MLFTVLCSTTTVNSAIESVEPCAIFTNTTVTLRAEEVLYLHFPHGDTTIKISSESCGWDKTIDLIDGEIVDPIVDWGKDKEGRIWHQMKYVQDNVHWLNIVIIDEETRMTPIYVGGRTGYCINGKTLVFEFSADTLLAVDVFCISGAMMGLYNGNTPYYKSFGDGYDPIMEIPDQKFPTYEYEPVKVRSYGYTRSLYIPIGGIIFVVAFCLRVCLYFCGDKEVRNHSESSLDLAAEAGGSSDSRRGSMEEKEEDNPPPYSEMVNHHSQPPPDYSDIYSDIQNDTTTPIAERGSRAGTTSQEMSNSVGDNADPTPSVATDSSVATPTDSAEGSSGTTPTGINFSLGTMLPRNNQFFYQRLA